MRGNVVSVERLVAASPERIFQVLADPTQHPLIDGSGTVRAASRHAPQGLALGSTFTMSMRIGLPYSMLNTVIEYEENRLIAWQARLVGRPGRFIGGRIWRFELCPVESATQVKETWDISRDRQRLLLRLGGIPDRTRRSMAKSLARLEKLVDEAPRPT